ncbi:MAG: DNA mismatch repair endonuclease MutL [Planctomycetes bacterium]|nr:DNA mismatch repair endonuclease MutL [Planctomycetota bacterium]
MIAAVLPRIRKLPEHVVNQIAAGEVIERPASVVKELVENALDAAASAVEVDLEEGGLRLVQVADNGLGIHADDLLLAVTSHATSKLAASEDLARITTLGFRGEALASIASIAELELVSRPPGAACGESVAARDGSAARAAPAMIPHGTRVRVRNLFASVPARRRFLRSARAELARVSAVLQHLALAMPAAGFTLRHEGRTLFRFPAGQSAAERLREVLGTECAERMIEIGGGAAAQSGLAGERGEAHIAGWVGRPDLAKANGASIHAFLNGRFISDRTVLHAVREAYRGFQIPGKYPVAALFLALDPAAVDVNVHPTKLEVRFRDQSAVHSLVFRAVRAALEGAGAVPSLFAAGAAVAPRTMERGDAEGRGAWHGRSRAERAEIPPAAFARNAGVVAEARTVLVAERLAGIESCGAEPRVFQVNDSYLVVEEAAGLTIIDQHALHEKVIYEELRAARESATLRQPLLVPETVRLTPGQWSALAEAQPHLAEIGFDVEEFGAQTVLVRALPSGCSGDGVPIAELLGALLDHAAERAESGAEARADLREPLLATLACKRAVKAGQRLLPAAQLDLVRARARAFHPQNCPHGRPAELFISWQELERRFDRK